MNDKVHHVTDASFEADVLNSSMPVLVDFWAEWCGPCKMIGPLVDDIADSHDGKVKVVKINIDNNPGTPRKFAVRGIPTLMLFKDGKVQATQVGAVGKAQLAAFVDGNLGGRPVDAVAQALADRAIPFAFVTGYSREALPAPFRDAPLLAKPFGPDQLSDTLRGLLPHPRRPT